jgi:hypothetical protein
MNNPTFIRQYFNVVCEKRIKSNGVVILPASFGIKKLQYLCRPVKSRQTCIGPISLQISKKRKKT